MLSLSEARRGRRGEYAWFVVPHGQYWAAELIEEKHVGFRLAVLAFDSGPVTPDRDERAIGWSLNGEAMVSPELSPGLHVPMAENDEWALFGQNVPELCEFEAFCRHFGFSLAAPDWNGPDADGVRSLQAQFWTQIDRLRPDTYAVFGDFFSVATRDKAFAESFETRLSQLLADGVS